MTVPTQRSLTSPRYRTVLLEELAAHGKAREASAQYVKRSEDVDEYCFVNGLSPFQRSQKRSNDWQLTDAFNGWHFWQREALRLKAEREALKELEG